MRVHVLERSQHLPLAIDEVFPFYANAGNLEAITPPWLGFRVVGDGPVEMRAGAFIEYRLRLHAIPVSWRTRIAEWVPNERFVDEQISGPYRLWHHTHTFESAADGGTIIRDRVRYRLPFGPFGAIAHLVLVRRDLAKIFDYRQAAVERLLLAADATSPRRPTPAASAAYARRLGGRADVRCGELRGARRGPLGFAVPGGRDYAAPMTPDAPDSPVSAKLRVVIAGGGVAGLEAVLALHALAGERVDVTLLTPEEEFAYRPLSVAEPFGLGPVRSYRVDELVAGHGARVVTGRLDGVDPDRRIALVQNGADQELAFDELVLAMGADRSTVFPEALTFVDQGSVPGFRDLLGAVERGEVKRLAFVVPPGPVWPFPLYELAMMTAVFAEQHGQQVEITLSSPATTPLALFGPTAEKAMADMLDAHGIVVHGGYDPDVVERGRVLLRPDGPAIEADRVVALPRLTGPRIAGLPHDPSGFIPVDDHGRVEGVEGVWAAGDCTTFPVKQGGLASQQADVVAAALAAHAGADVEAPAFAPVLRGVLLTGRSPTWLRARMKGGRIEESALSETALWWPPSKIAGRYLAPALGVRDDAAALADPKEGVPVEVRLETRLADHPGVRRRALISHAYDSEEPKLIEFGPDR